MKIVSALLIAATLVSPIDGRAVTRSATLGLGLTIVASCDVAACRAGSTLAAPAPSNESAPFYVTFRPAAADSPGEVTTTY